MPRRFAPRDGGIPQFIDLPPSPFRGNDRLVLDICVDLCVSVRCSIAGRHSGRPMYIFARNIALRLGHGFSERYLSIISAFAVRPISA